MKKLMILLSLVLLTGCASKEEKELKKQEKKLLGTWETKYELGAFGEVSEKYTFKKENKCIRTINTGTDITDDCTYEFNEDRTQIRILWDNKLDKDGYSKFEVVDDNNIMISEHKYTKQN